MSCFELFPHEENESESWAELHQELWSSFEALNFAGDGRPGVGDVLEDARWESRWGVDGGRVILGPEMVMFKGQNID